MQPFTERSPESGDQPDANVYSNVRMTVQEAAAALGITVEAVRGRIAFLRAELEARNAEIRRREEEHREEARRKDTIIAQLTQRIPELESPREAPREARESPETASESPTTAREWPLGDDQGETYGTSPQEAEESLHRPRKRSWWRAFFGLE